MTERLRLGVAGLGVASTLFLPGVEGYSHAVVSAAADRRQSARDAFFKKYSAPAYESVEQLCRDPNIDVVWIATPNQYHCDHTVLAADHGKHVICTKPMALDIAQCERMCDAADQNGVKLLCGQTISMSPDIHALWQARHSANLGRLIAINCLFYTDWLIKPRVAEELDEALGGGVVFRHAPHLVDTVRLLGGGLVRSVRASVGRWMAERPCPGNFSAYLEFEDGTPATIIYNGYGYFDTSELTWGIGNRMYSDAERVEVRRGLRSGNIDDTAAKEGMRFGAGATDAASRGRGANASQSVGSRAHMPWFGITLASFERGDIRQSPNGIYIYDDHGRREVSVEGGRDSGLLEMKELYNCLAEDKPIIHDGRWAMATLEVGTAMVTSSAERREVILTHQCAIPG